MSSGGGFWTSSWGRVVRQLGIYAAGVIPFVGAFASFAAKFADQQVFAAKTKRQPTAPVVARPATVIAPHGALFVEPGELSSTLPVPLDASINNGSGPANSLAGSRGFFETPDLQSVSKSPSLSAIYFALGAAIIIGVIIFLRRR